MNDEKRVIVNLSLPPHQAQALAKLADLSFHEMKRLAVDDEQAFALRDALDQLLPLIAAQGFAPR